MKMVQKYLTQLELKKVIKLFKDNVIGVEFITKKGNKVILNPGDMLLYKGFHLEHWREPLKKGKCVQLFLHYVNVKDANAEELKYDGRHMLGADALLRRKINNNLKKD